MAKALPLPPVAVSPRPFARRSALWVPHSRPRRSLPAAIETMVSKGISTELDGSSGPSDKSGSTCVVT